MSLRSLARKAKRYYADNGIRATLRMARRYSWWRLRAVLFRLRYGRTIAEVGSSLKVRGDVRVRSGENATLAIGDTVEIVGNLGRTTFFKIGGTLQIEDEVFINRGCEIYASESITFEYDATVAPNVVFRDSDMHSVGDGSVKRGPITVGAGSWIGTGSIVLKGVTIGENAVVAAGSVVTDDVPPETVVGGVPATRIDTIES